MNNINLIGRLTKDTELRYTNSNKAYARFTLAVNRNFKNEAGEYDTDFITCVAWEKRAENISKYVKKGNRLAVEGRLQTSSYDKEDGSKGYLTDVIVSGFEFLESKAKEDSPEPEYREPVKKETESDPFADFGEQIELNPEDYPFEID